MTPFSQTPFSQTPFSQTPFSQTPFSQTPFSQTPFSQTTDPRDPAISNSTFYIAPAGTSAPSYRAKRPISDVRYVLRAYQITPNPPVLIVQNGQAQVGVTVISDTPAVKGGVFDPGGPTQSSGGAAVPVRLAFVTQPSSTAPGASITPPVQVAILDGFGNIVTGSTPSVTLTIGNNPSGGTLSGVTTRRASEENGIASFAGLSINNAGAGYTLVASSGTLEQATSQAFNISSLMITTLALPNATAGVEYSHQLFATGGTPPYSWIALDLSGIGFDIPTWLSLNVETGVLSGTPPAAEGGRTFRVKVTDFLGQFATQDLCIHVDASTAGPLVADTGIWNPQTFTFVPATPAQIAQTLVGENVAITNVDYKGAATALGTFRGGFPATGLSSGIVLSSGSAPSVAGTNSSDALTHSNGTPGDADLDGLIPLVQACVPGTPGATCDAAILEFDFMVTDADATIVKFDYILASEEYNEFVNTQFNDVFGFFLSGPGIPNSNFALVPGTTTPVSINNVNGGNPFSVNASNSSYYINNDRNDLGSEPLLSMIQADGFTKVLTLQATILPNTTYHMKLAIADAGDRSLNSWVLIKAQSLTAACPIIQQ